MAEKVINHVAHGACYAALLGFPAFSFALDLLVSVHGSRVLTLLGL